MNEQVAVTRTILLKSTNPEWIERVVSKLLIGGSRWEWSWSNKAIQVTTTHQNLHGLARLLTSPTIHVGIQKLGDVKYADSKSWQMWKQDSRFMEYLTTDDLFDSVKDELYEVFLNEDMFDMEHWMSQQKKIGIIVAGLENDLCIDGKIADKLVADGWL